MYYPWEGCSRHREQPVQRLRSITHSRTEKRAVHFEWSEEGEEVIKGEVGEGRTLHTIEGGKMGFP